MSLTAMFVLGLLIGWLAEWVIDWYYWRSRFYSLVRENTHLKARNTALEADENKRTLLARIRLITDEQGNDNLQAIKGIGPVFSGRLNAAGITKFEQLSNLKSGELEAVLGTLYKRFYSKQDKIRAQAQEFAQLRAQGD